MPISTALYHCAAVVVFKSAPSDISTLLRMRRKMNVNKMAAGRWHHISAVPVRGYFYDLKSFIAFMSKTSDENCWKTKVCLKTEKFLKILSRPAFFPAAIRIPLRKLFCHFVTNKNMAFAKILALMYFNWKETVSPNEWLLIAFSVRISFTILKCLCEPLLCLNFLGLSLGIT